VIPLSPTAQAVLAAAPKIGNSNLVFTTDGKRPIAGFSKFKRAFDAKVLAELHRENPDAELPRWTLHDRRRTAPLVVATLAPGQSVTLSTPRALGQLAVEVRFTRQGDELFVNDGAKLPEVVTH
jgi:hypothetical protein